MQINLINGQWFTTSGILLALGAEFVCNVNGTECVCVYDNTVNPAAPQILNADTLERISIVSSTVVNIEIEADPAVLSRLRDGVDDGAYAED